MFKRHPSEILNFAKASRKLRKYEYESLFRKGCALVFWIYFLSLVFFAAWIFGHSNESLLVINSNSFTRIFFFLNPNIFHELIVGGKAIVYMQGAATADSFTLICCYLICLFSFVAIFLLSVWLFVISYHTSVKGFHYVSCLAIFPIIPFFLLTIPTIQLFIYKWDLWRKRAPRFKALFTKEKLNLFENQFLPAALSSREITEPFTFKQYKFYFRKDIKIGWTASLYQKLKSFLD